MRSPCAAFEPRTLGGGDDLLDWVHLTHSAPPTEDIRTMPLYHLARLHFMASPFPNRPAEISLWWEFLQASLDAAATTVGTTR